MALFTDGPPAVIEDLTAHDSQLLDVAKTEGIDVARKLALAHDEIAVELIALLSRGGRAQAGGWGVDHVVMTPPLVLWRTYKALELVYGDAYNSNLNDRFAGKRDRFRERAAWARERLSQLGIGVVFDPIPQAAAPDVAAASGSLAPGVYYVSAAWVNGSGEEGACSVPAVISVDSGGVLITPRNAPSNAAGWNAYLGACAEEMRLQNTSPVHRTETWTQDSPVQTTGRTAGSGQQPVYLEPAPRVIQRG